MANKNQMRVSVNTRKEQKKLGVKVNSRFGASGNLNKSAKNYQAISSKARMGN